MTPTEEQLRLLSRLSKTQDGKDFLEEILKPMLVDNHKDLLSLGKEYRDEMIGYGGCVEFLVGLFENCDIKLATQKKTEEPNADWS